LVVSTATWSGSIGVIAAAGRCNLGRVSRSGVVLLDNIARGHGGAGTDSVKTELWVHADVVVGKLAKVGVIDTNDLGFLASP
jgi:hypothetical protein